jgi:hypothetical protein
LSGNSSFGVNLPTSIYLLISNKLGVEQRN